MMFEELVDVVTKWTPIKLYMRDGGSNTLLSNSCYANGLMTGKFAFNIKVSSIETFMEDGHAYLVVTLEAGK